MFGSRAGETRGTLAVKPARRVGTLGVRSTAAVRSVRFVTFVDIDTTRRDVLRVESPAFLANTVRLLAVGFAEGVFAALDVLTWSCDMVTFQVREEFQNVSL